MIKLYSFQRSGNCWKVAFMLRQLKIPHEIVSTSILDGSTKSAEYTAKNPNGQVPLLELEDGRLLAESNAIMLYLAEKYNFLMPKGDSEDALFQRAQIYEMLFFEQYSHEKAIAVRRANMLFNRPCSKGGMQELLDKGHHALGVMEKKLGTKEGQSFLIGNEFTVADVALYAYTHVATEGGFDLERFPLVQAWLKRVQEMPGYCGMSILEEDKFLPTVN